MKFIKFIKAQALAAMAGILGVVLPGIAQAEDWNGAFIGAHLGAGATVHSMSAPSAPFSLDGTGANGIFGGLHAGYDLRAGRFVTGVQGEVGRSEQTFEIRLPSSGASSETKRIWDASISLRGGILPSEHTMLYGRVGYTRSRFKATVDTSGGSASAQEDFNGFHAGAGMETRIAPNASLRLEYRLTHYEKKNVGSAATPLFVKPRDHALRVGVSWRFDDATPDRGPKVADDWTGFFLGIQAASAAHDTRVRSGGDSLDGIAGDGLMGGIFAGYDYQFGPRTVVGVELNAGMARVKSTGAFGSSSASARLDHTYGASGRIGWLAQPETLLYLRAGWTRGRFSGKANASGRKIDANGLLTGIGMETRLNAATSLLLEYRHVQFAERKIGTTNVRPALDAGSVGVAWRF